MTGVVQRAARRLGAIALLAMLVRALVPGGYMLAAAESSQGRFLVVQMCDGHATPSLAVDLETGDLTDLSKKQKNPFKQGSSAPCAFAVSVAMTTPVSASEPVCFARQDEAIASVPPAVTPGRCIPAPPPPSTGPPQDV